MGVSLNGDTPKTPQNDHPVPKKPLGYGRRLPCFTGVLGISQLNVPPFSEDAIMFLVRDSSD